MYRGDTESGGVCVCTEGTERAEARGAAAAASGLALAPEVGGSGGGLDRRSAAVAAALQPLPLRSFLGRRARVCAAPPLLALRGRRRLLRALAG